MKINYNVTGAERKSLVAAVSQELNATAKYLGMPSAAYEVGGYTVTKTGELIGEDNRELVADLCGLHSFRAVSEEYDTPLSEAEETPAFESLELTEREELGLGRERRDHPGEDGMQPSDVPDSEDEYPDIDQHHPGQYANPDAPMTETMLRQVAESFPPETEDGGDTLAIEMPLDGFTDETIANLEKLIASKAGLIKKALGAETLTVEKSEHRLRFPWFKPGLEPEDFTAYAWFISALCGAAKEQKRVTAKEKPVDNEKFAFRVFLIRLGFVGDQYKNARKILLRNLTGNSAFKNGRPEQTASPAESTDTGMNSLAETLADAELIHAVNASLEDGGAGND